MPEFDCPAPGFDFPTAIQDLCDSIEDMKASVAESQAELGSLTDGRCTANMLFIEALKEHKIAIDIVGQLMDMSANFEHMSEEPASFAQTEAI